MIHWKKKDFAQPPAKLQREKCAEQIQKAVQEKNGDKYTTTYYQDQSVLNALRAYSINQEEYDEDKEEAKCYYCESFCDVVATLQVEHYRPKAKICDADNKKIEGTNGYYWLGCEWSNLLLACPKCNGSGAKGNKFPIKGERVLDGNPIEEEEEQLRYTREDCWADTEVLQKEDPLLLHPEVDEIVSRFRFSMDGEIEGVDEKGRMSVRIYTLDRPQLNLARKKLKQELQNKINEIIMMCEKGFISFDQMENIFQMKCRQIAACNHPSKAYTLWAKYFNEHFKEYFVETVPEKYKEALWTAYVSTVSES